MAPNAEDAPQNSKTLHVWSKPVEQPTGDGSQSDGKKLAPPTVSEAVGMIKSEDFVNVHNTPCARQGFLAGIAAGAGFGGLRFIVRGNAVKAANWAVGMFVLGSAVSYEYCQYLRRAERIQMKRHIEIVTENRREQARRLAEERQEQSKSEQERVGAQAPWYKFW